MNDDQLTQDIRDANLSYLTLAQQLIRQNPEQAQFRFGITPESADLIERLSADQVRNIASSPMLLCRFKVDDDLVWGLLTSHGTPARGSQGGTSQRTTTVQ